MELQIHSGDAGASVVGSLTVSDDLFGAWYNESLVHQVVTAFLATSRAGTKAQKSRSQVRGGGRKPWRQKGTGRARAGSSRSPLWRKGGVTFAAAPRDYSQKVNRKMYRGALRSILSELVRQGRLRVLQSFSLATPKTRVLVDKLQALGVRDVLIVTEDVDQNIYLASRNLPDVAVRDAASVDPVSLIDFDQVLVTKEAVEQIQDRLR